MLNKVSYSYLIVLNYLFTFISKNYWASLRIRERLRVILDYVQIFLNNTLGNIKTDDNKITG